MEIKEVSPDKITVSELNERKEVNGVNDPNGDSLEDSVAEVGIVNPPIVREQDGKNPYEVVVGQRRVLAAQGAGLETIPVVVQDYSDMEAMAASVTDNFRVLQEDVAPGDRAEILKRMWEEAGNDGFPSSSWLADKIGAKQTTVSTWLEPLRNSSSNDNRYVSNSLDVKKQEIIRLAVKDSELDFDEVAERVIEEDLTQTETKTLRKYIEKGASLDTAVKHAKKKNQSDSSSNKEVVVERSSKPDDDEESSETEEDESESEEKNEREVEPEPASEPSESPESDSSSEPEVDTGDDTESLESDSEESETSAWDEALQDSDDEGEQQKTKNPIPGVNGTMFRSFFFRNEKAERIVNIAKSLGYEFETGEEFSSQTKDIVWDLAEYYEESELNE